MLIFHRGDFLIIQKQFNMIGINTQYSKHFLHNGIMPMLLYGGHPIRSDYDLIKKNLARSDEN